MTFVEAWRRWPGSLRVASLLLVLVSVTLVFHLTTPFFRPAVVALQVDAGQGEVWIGDYRLASEMQVKWSSGNLDRARKEGRAWLPPRRLPPGRTSVQIPMHRQPGTSFWGWYAYEVSFGWFGSAPSAFRNGGGFASSRAGGEMWCVCAYKDGNWDADVLVIQAKRGSLQMDPMERSVAFIPDRLLE